MLLFTFIKDSYFPQRRNIALGYASPMVFQDNQWRVRHLPRTDQALISGACVPYAASPVESQEP